MIDLSPSTCCRSLLGLSVAALWLILCLPQIWGECKANANSPLSLVESGLKQYLALGIPASKLILGVPW